MDVANLIRDILNDSPTDSMETNDPVLMYHAAIPKASMSQSQAADPGVVSPTQSSMHTYGTRVIMSPPRAERNQAVDVAIVSPTIQEWHSASRCSLSSHVDQVLKNDDLFDDGSLAFAISPPTVSVDSAFSEASLSDQGSQSSYKSELVSSDDMCEAPQIGKNSDTDINAKGKPPSKRPRNYRKMPARYKERKRVQNRVAALRYRQKKKAEMEELEKRAEQDAVKVAELIERNKKLDKEIEIVERFLNSIVEDGSWLPHNWRQLAAQVTKNKM